MNTKALISYEQLITLIIGAICVAGILMVIARATSGGFTNEELAIQAADSLAKFIEYSSSSSHTDCFYAVRLHDLSLIPPPETYVFYVTHSHIAVYNYKHINFQDPNWGITQSTPVVYKVIFPFKISLHKDTTPNDLESFLWRAQSNHQQHLLSLDTGELLLLPQKRSLQALFKTQGSQNVYTTEKPEGLFLALAKPSKEQTGNSLFVSANDNGDNLIISRMCKILQFSKTLQNQLHTKLYQGDDVQTLIQQVNLFNYKLSFTPQVQNSQCSTFSIDLAEEQCKNTDCFATLASERSKRPKECLYNVERIWRPLDKKSFVPSQYIAQSAVTYLSNDNDLKDLREQYANEFDKQVLYYALIDAKAHHLDDNFHCYILDHNNKGYHFCYPESTRTTTSFDTFSDIDLLSKQKGFYGISSTFYTYHPYDITKLESGTLYITGYPSNVTLVSFDDLNDFSLLFGSGDNKDFFVATMTYEHKGDILKNPVILSQEQLKDIPLKQ